MMQQGEYGGVKFAIQVNAAASSSGSLSALGFIEAALSGGHEIVRVFFYHDGVYCVRDAAQWSRLATEKNIDLVVCVSAAHRRAVIAVDELEHPDASRCLPAGFRLGGLSMWVDACLQADRFIQFGE